MKSNKQFMRLVLQALAILQVVIASSEESRITLLNETFENCANNVLSGCSQDWDTSFAGPGTISTLDGLLNSSSLVLRGQEKAKIALPVAGFEELSIAWRWDFMNAQLGDGCVVLEDSSEGQISTTVIAPDTVNETFLGGGFSSRFLLWANTYEYNITLKANLSESTRGFCAFNTLVVKGTLAPPTIAPTLAPTSAPTSDAGAGAFPRILASVCILAMVTLA